MAGLNGISTLPNNFSSVNVNSTSAAETQASAAKVTVSTVQPAATAADQARVSSTGGLVAQALSTSDVRQEKVLQLQASIASGTYSVSSAEVASKIVDNLLR